MATLTYQQVSTLGTPVALQAATSSGDAVAPSDRGGLIIRNGSGAAVNVTLLVPGNTRYGQPQPDPVIAVAAGATEVIAPLPSDLADTDGLVHVTYSAVASVTVGAITI